MTTTALLTDMNESLAPCAGNAIEVRCAIDYLTGKSRPARLHEVTMALCVELLASSGQFEDKMAGNARLERSLSDGSAAEIFQKMVAALGGPTDLVEHADRHLHAAPVVMPVLAPADGVVQAFDTRALGLAVVTLGGGRQRATDVIDPTVGLSEIISLGTEVKRGDLLMHIEAANLDDAERARASLMDAITFGDTVPAGSGRARTSAIVEAVRLR